MVGAMKLGDDFATHWRIAALSLMLGLAACTGGSEEASDGPDDSTSASELAGLDDEAGTTSTTTATTSTEETSDTAGDDAAPDDDSSSTTSTARASTSTTAIQPVPTTARGSTTSGSPDGSTPAHSAPSPDGSTVPAISGLTGLIVDLDLDAGSMTLCLGASNTRTFVLKDDGSYAFDLHHLSEHRTDGAPVLVVTNRAEPDLIDDIYDAAMIPALEAC